MPALAGPVYECSLWIPGHYDRAAWRRYKEAARGERAAAVPTRLRRQSGPDARNAHRPEPGAVTGMPDGTGPCTPGSGQAATGHTVSGSRAASFASQGKPAAGLAGIAVIALR